MQPFWIVIYLMIVVPLGVHLVARETMPLNVRDAVDPIATGIVVAAVFWVVIVLAYVYV